eukprot:s2064_g17.t1
MYATEESFASPGAHILRPWMLPHRSDYGLRGTCDDVQKCLAQLILLNSFLSNPDNPGTEKLVICSSDERWLTSKRVWIAPREIGELQADLLAPQSVFAVKGFNRSTCALLVMLACYELAPLMEAGSILCSPRYLVGLCGPSADLYCDAKH